MLRVYVGDLEECLWDIDAYFNIWFDTSNLLDSFAKKVIKEIDKSDVLNENVILSPVLGSISPSFLSGGTKALLLLYYNDVIVNLNALGENCYQILVDISRIKDITICIKGVNSLFINTDLSEVLLINNNLIINNALDYFKEVRKLRGVN